MEPSDRLESWKEIAAYLGRDIRTAQRWEASEDLPVHRHQHKKRGSVFALRSELDAWRASRSAEFFNAPDPEPVKEPLPRTPGRRPVLLAAALCIAVLVAALSPRLDEGPHEAALPSRLWDAPRLLGEATRDGGTIERIPIAGSGERLALSPDGRTLFVLICKVDGTSDLQAIDARTRASLWTVESFGGCAPMVMSASGDRLITGSKSDVVVLDTATRLVRRIATPAADLRDFALAGDGRTLYVAALFRGLLEVDLTSGQVLTRSPLPCPVTLALSPANGRLYVGYQCSGPGGRPGHDAIDIFDTEQGRSLGSITSLPNVGSDLVVSPDGSQLWADGGDACVSAYYDKLGCPSGSGSIVNVVATNDHSLLRSLRVGGPEEFNMVLAFLRDGSGVVAGRFETSVISTASLEAVESFPLALMSNVVFSPDGRAGYAVMGNRQSVAVLEMPQHPAPPSGLTGRWTADGVHTDTAGGNEIPKEVRVVFGPGRIGQAFEARDGSPIRLSRPTNLGLDARWTTMMWVKAEGAGTVMEFAAIDSEGSYGFRLSARSDGLPELCLGRYEPRGCGGPGSTTISGDTALIPGQWHHLAVTRSDDSVVLYLDKRRVATGNGLKGGFPLTDTLFLRFGSDEAGDMPLRGWLDEIEIYNRPLSPGEIAERGK
jgi:DNA-binding beta-propeller fold protein YncE